MKNRKRFFAMAILLFATVSINTSANTCADSCNTHFGGQYDCVQYVYWCDPGSGNLEQFVVSSCLEPLPDADPTQWRSCHPWF